MKYYLLIVISIMILGCEENLSVKGEFREGYVLYSILKGEDTKHFAILSKFYDVPEFDPLTNTNDPNIDGARIRLWRNSTVYVFKDTLVDRQDTSRYKGKVKAYYLENFTLGAEEKLEIEVLLPNKKLLKSFTEIPSGIEFESSTNTRNIPSTSFANPDIISVAWSENERFINLYEKKLVMTYSLVEDGIRISKKLRIPIDRINGMPFFGRPNYNPEIDIPLEIVTSELRRFSDEHNLNTTLLIEGIKLEVLVYDKNLSAYLITSNFLDSFSIRLDQIDFSNIDGGRGVFGSYAIYNWQLVFNEDYIRRLGLKLKK